VASRAACHDSRTLYDPLNKVLGGISFLPGRKASAFVSVLKAPGCQNGRYFSAADHPTEFMKMKRPIEQAR
jgi:hypothetical protein